MNVSEIIADCNCIMLFSSHIYCGSRDDCRVLSDTFGRTVVSCRNFAVQNNKLLHSLISIVEAIFDDYYSKIVVVSSNGVPVFWFRENLVNIPDKYEFLDDNTAWQIDIHFLAQNAAPWSPYFSR